MSPDGPPFAVEPEVVAVLETLWRSGQAAYLVGGGVRDALLGLPGSDWDVATDARPEGILRIFPGGTYQNRFGTVKARGLEITTFRRDHRYADHRRPDSVTFSDDIYEDLARRDLTINAIAWGRRGDAMPARFVDPADGRGDLRARLVRAVGDPARRFDEDALRLLRAVRIAARLDFTIEPITRAALVAHAGDVAWVSEERIGDEMRRMLAMDRPSRAIRLLRETGLLASTLPELEERLQREGAAGEDLFARGLAVLDAVASPRPDGDRLLWAALLGETTTGETRAALERLRVAGRDRDAVCLLVERAAVDADRDWSDADVRRFMGSLPPELLDDLLTLRHARASVAGEEQLAREVAWQERVLAQRLAGSALVVGDLAIDGQDLQVTLGIPEGPTVGRILERLIADVVEDPGLNRRMPLLTRAGFILDELLHGDVDGPERANLE